MCTFSTGSVEGACDDEHFMLTYITYTVCTFSTGSAKGACDDEERGRHITGTHEDYD